MPSPIDHRIPARFKRDTSLDLEEGLVMLCYVGSLSHGTHVASDDPDAIDDVDLMGVYVPPRRYTLGLGTWEHWVVKEAELDVTIYSLRKFIGLLLKSNPNVLGTLWLRDEDYLLTSPLFRWVIEERAAFSSLETYSAFAGYASAQMKKMTAPQRYEGYMGAKRKELVDRFGYDVKNAAHLIRLMRMCIEFLQTGTFRVWRDDASELIEIKRGKWAIQAVETEAERLFAQAKRIRDENPKGLPRLPDYEAADALVQSIHLATYGLHAA